MPQNSQPNRVREIRNQNELSLKELADLSGVFFTQIAKIETGGRPAKDFEFRRLAKPLGVLPADLFNCAEGGLSSTERHIIDCYRSAPPDFRKAIDAFFAANGIFPER